MSEETPAAAGKKRGCGFYGLMAAGVLAGLVVLGSLGQQEKRDEREAAAAGKPDAAGAPMTEVSARDLQRAFAGNEVAAKQTYGNRRLKVSGTIASIDLDITDNPVVVLATGDDFNRVHARFEKDDSAAIAALAKGQKAAVVCDRIDEVAGTPMLSDCSLAR